MLATFLYAACGEEDRMDPGVFRWKPSGVFDGDMAYWLAGIYGLRGERQPALVWLRRAVALGNHNYPSFARDMNFDRLRPDADYQRLLAEVRSQGEQYRAAFGKG
jgi:hypothetical protein